MNDAQLTDAVHSAMQQQCEERGYAAPVDILMSIGVLPRKQYEAWRFGRVNYLESVCTVNLRKLSLIMRQVCLYANNQGLKPSFCYYKQWGSQKKNGHGNQSVSPLQFSKSGNPEIERWYATHFVDTKRTAQIKAKKQNSNIHEEQS